MAWVQGDEVAVKFGGFGHQFAVVINDNGGEDVSVMKWRDNSRRWTKVVKVRRDSILGLAGYVPNTVITRARQTRTGA